MISPYYRDQNILILAAHPDDEVLGCGGTMARFSHEGANVHVVFFTDGVGARCEDVDINECVILRRKAAKNAADILGVKSITFGTFPDNQLDSINLIDLVQFVEKQVDKISPTIVLTHHAHDLNIDHRLVNQAALTACRPQPGCSVRILFFFEVASSTEWQIANYGNVFVPHCFINISKYLTLRARALNAYRDEMRDWPHSRSIRALDSLVSWRGATVGVEAAEAFMLGRAII